MKRKITAVFMSLTLLFTMSAPAPAFALDRSTFGCWQDPFTWWQDMIDWERMGAPKITQATYCHKNAAYSGFDNHLQIVWDDVEGAESYLVEITKADGSWHIYTTDAPCLYIKAGYDDFLTGCPKVYVEDTHTWTAATVRVRAVAHYIPGKWSETKKISCNAIHW